MSRRLRIAVLVSVILHLAVLAAFLPALRRAPPAADKPDKEAAVELLLVEKKGAGSPIPPSSAAPSPPSAAAPPQQVQPEKAQPPSPPLPRKVEHESRPEAPVSPATPPQVQPPSPPLPQDAKGELGPTPPAPATPPPRVAANAAPHPPASQPTPEAKPHPPVPPQPKAPPADVPVFNLGGTDSESNAIVSGDQVIPASPDDAARNRPPVYPQQAAMLHQQGTVTVVIHVSPQGTTEGIDILQGSGHILLDRAVLDAVRNWRFLPAVKDGQPVPFDMPMRFVFQAN